MHVPKKLKGEEKSYELQWLEAERELAILEYENNNWLHKQLEVDNET